MGAPEDVMHYHGTPITPSRLLHELSGRNFCVSFATPRQTEICHKIGQSVMLDNGAFSVWKRGIEIDWRAWSEWAGPWLDTPTTWGVLPDSIDGGEEMNDRLLLEWSHMRNTVPVWHLHETLGRLLRLVNEYGKVCFGSSGSFVTVGTDSWHRRVSLAFDAISNDQGQVPWVHMLRGMSMSGDIYPFASVDSTDVARNHNRPQNNVIKLADRWDGRQCPSRWERREQLSMEEANA